MFKQTLSVFILGAVLVSASAKAAGQTEKFVVTGAACMDGKPFNAAESTPIGTVYDMPSGTRNDIQVSNNASLFYLREDHRNLFMLYRVTGQGFEYKSGSGPCSQNVDLLISLERVQR